MWDSNSPTYYKPEREYNGDVSRYPSSFPESREMEVDVAEISDIKLSFPPPEDDLAMVDSDEFDEPRGLEVLQNRTKCRIKIGILIALALVALGVVTASLVPTRKDKAAVAGIQQPPNNPLTGDGQPTASPIEPSPPTVSPTMAETVVTADMQIIFQNVSEMMSAEVSGTWTGRTSSYLENSLLSEQVNISLADQIILSARTRRLQAENTLLVDFSVTSVSRGAETLGETALDAILQPEYLEDLKNASEYFASVPSLQARVAPDSNTPVTVPTVTPATATATPSVNPTLAPIPAATSSPTASPISASPVASPPATMAPIPMSQSPTRSPSTTPTTLSPVTLSPTTSFPVTSTPISTAPVPEPTGKPVSADNRICNGVEGLCNAPVNEIMFAKSHNSHSTVEAGFGFPNHRFSLEDSLVAGVRALSLDFGLCFSDVVLFHSFCFLGTTPPPPVFESIQNFLVDNPNEVLVISMQIEGVDLTELYGLMEGVPKVNEQDDAEPRFVDRFYEHTSGQPWPTLGELIDQGTNIVLFHYNGPSCDQIDCPRGFMDYFKYAVETPFSFKDEQALSNTSESCRLDRGRNGSKDFFGINIFLEIPNEEASARLNGIDALDRHVTACEIFTGADANFVVYDFWKSGDVIDFVQFRNELLVASL